MTGGNSRKVPSRPCKKCSKNLTAVLYPGLTCYNCDAHFHYQCAGIDKASFELLLEKKLHLSWACVACNNNPTNKRRSSFFGSLPLPATASQNTSKSPSLAQRPATSTVGSSLSSRVTTKPKASTDTERISKLERLLQEALERINSLEKSNLELITKLNDKTADIDKLVSEVDVLGSAASSIEQSAIDNTLEVRHLPQPLLDDPTTAITALGAQIGCKLSEVDYSILSSRDSKVLRLSFTSPIKRRTFLTAGKKFNRDNKRFLFDGQLFHIHVNAELTTYQKRLYQASKTFRRIYGFKFSWYDINGNLWLKKGEGSTPHLIRSLSDLDTKNENLLPELSRPSDQEPELLSGGSSE